MTQIPEGRQPLQSDDMAKLHPSTWDQQCAQLVAENEQLRAGVATLEEALKRLIDIAEQCDLPEWAGFHMDQARAALEAKP